MFTNLHEVCHHKVPITHTSRRIKALRCGCQVIIRIPKFLQFLCCQICLSFVLETSFWLLTLYFSWRGVWRGYDSQKASLWKGDMNFSPILSLVSLFWIRGEDAVLCRSALVFLIISVKEAVMHTLKWILQSQMFWYLTTVCLISAWFSKLLSKLTFSACDPEGISKQRVHLVFPKSPSEFGFKFSFGILSLTRLSVSPYILMINTIIIFCARSILTTPVMYFAFIVDSIRRVLAGGYLFGECGVPRDEEQQYFAGPGGVIFGPVRRSLLWSPGLWPGLVFWAPLLCA